MKDEYMTGVQMIDDEHKKLFEIGERAYQLLKNHFAIDKYDKIISIVDELKNYTELHFNDEEKYILKHF